MCGYAFKQIPWQNLEKLRHKPVEIQERVIRNTESLDEFRPDRNTYEIEATFNQLTSGQNFGMNFCVGENQKVVLGYDTSTANVYLDRRTSGNIAFNPRFPRKVVAPLEPHGESITFRVFVDQSSIEVFVNDGEVVLSSLIFPDPAGKSLQLFSLNGEAILHSLKAWELKSIWN
jgi:sucrose-6-phosphate hydrolase SacC (GH32 family)